MFALFTFVVSTWTTEKVRCETRIHRVVPDEGTYMWTRPGKKRERDMTLSILQVSNWAQYSSLIFLGGFTLGMNSLVEWQKEEEEMKWEDGYRRGLNKTKTNRQIVQSGTFSCGHGFLQGLLQHRSHHVISSYRSNMGLSHIKG